MTCMTGNCLPFCQVGLSMEVAGVVMRVATFVVVLAASVVGMTMLPQRSWSNVARALGFVLLGLVVAAIVFGVQSGNVGASLGGAVLALAIGAIAVLLVVLFRSV
jgi:hypothetical protein